MFVFRTDASAKSGFHLLEQGLYFVSLLKKKVAVLFCVDRDKKVIKALQQKKMPFCLPEDLFKNPVTGICFYVENFSPADGELLDRAKKNHIKTIQIAVPGSEGFDTGCNYTLSGPLYALLHNRFRHFNKVKRKYRKKTGKILVFPEDRLEYRELRDLIDLLSRKRLNIKIVPPSYLKGSYQKILKRIYPGIRFVGDTDCLARPFFETDTALIIPGTAAYEAAAAGTPALYLVHGTKRQSAVEAFVKEQIGINVTTGETLCREIENLTLQRRIAMGTAGKKWVDGKGVYRVIDFLKEKGII